MPEWVKIVLGAMGGTSLVILWDYIKRKKPTPRERMDTDKVVAEAVLIRTELTGRMEEMVRAKTADLTERIEDLKKAIAEITLEHREEVRRIADTAAEQNNLLKKKLTEVMTSHQQCEDKYDALKRELDNFKNKSI